MVVCLMLAGCGEIARTTNLIGENQKAIQTSTEAVQANQRAVELSTATIAANEKALQRITDAIAKNASGIQKSTEAIQQNEEAVVRITQTMTQYTPTREQARDATILLAAGAVGAVALLIVLTLGVWRLNAAARRISPTPPVRWRFPFPRKHESAALHPHGRTSPSAPQHGKQPT